jgi:hypothetical protein
MPQRVKHYLGHFLLIDAFYLLGFINNAFGYFFKTSLKFLSASILVLKLPTQTL